MITFLISLQTKRDWRQPRICSEDWDTRQIFKKELHGLQWVEHTVQPPFIVTCKYWVKIFSCMLLRSTVKKKSWYNINIIKWPEPSEVLFFKYCKSITTGNRLSSSTVELAFSLFVYLKCMYMSTYTVFAVFATDDQWSTFSASHHVALVYRIQVRKINKHRVCSHVKQHLSNNKSDNMGNNYEVYFGIKLTGKQFVQKKNQGLVFNHLWKRMSKVENKYVTFTY